MRESGESTSCTVGHYDNNGRRPKTTVYHVFRLLWRVGRVATVFLRAIDLVADINTESLPTQLLANQQTTQYQRPIGTNSPIVSLTLQL